MNLNMMMDNVMRICRFRINGFGKDRILDALVTNFYRNYRICTSKDSNVVVDQHLYKKELIKQYQKIMIYIFFKNVLRKIRCYAHRYEFIYSKYYERRKAS